MNTNDLIKKLEDLHEKATAGEWDVHDWEADIRVSGEDADYITALHNAFPQIIKALKAGERLRDEVSDYAVHLKVYLCTHGQDRTLLELVDNYDEAIKEDV